MDALFCDGLLSPSQSVSTFRECMDALFCDEFNVAVLFR
jgi:hypothetical protein